MTSRILLVAGFSVLAVTIGAEPLRPVFVVTALLLTATVVRISSSNDLSTGEIIFAALVFRLLLLPALPALSDDAFRYIWDGMLQWQGINPFLHLPGDTALADFHGHPVFSRLNSADYHTVYPPLSQAFFSSTGWLNPGSWPIAYVMMKLVVVGCEMAAIIILSRLVRPSALALYAWNPLVVIEMAGQLHTEALMVPALVVCVAAFRNARPATATIALSSAIWIKLYPILLVPFLLRRVGWSRVWIVVVVSAFLVAPYLHPEIFANVGASLALYVGFFEFYSGPYLALKWLSYKLGGTHGLELVLGLTLATLYLGFVIRLFLLDVRRRWSLPAVMFFVLAGFIVAATTVHPWYFLGLLVVLPMAPINPHPWIWLSAFSTATYLFYTHGVYWPFVWIGWGGWAVLIATSTETGQTLWREGIERILRKRAADKAGLVRPHLDAGTEERVQPLSVLDLGAGEGYVGRALQDSGRFNVTLCDIRSSNDTELPFVVYDGRELPFGDDWFDATMLVFTLHHCEDHIAVLREATRVTAGRIVILESVYASEPGRRFLALADRLANRVRSRGRMDPYQHFRKTEDWIELLENSGFEIESVRRSGRLHRQALIVATHRGRP